MVLKRAWSKPLKTDTYGNAGHATPPVDVTYDVAYGRLLTIVDAAGTTTYGYHQVTTPPTNGAGQVASIDGPLPLDTITYSYDELGRVVGRAIDGVGLTVTYDSGGRIKSESNPLGVFTYAYQGATERVESVAYPNGQVTSYAYLDGAGDRRLQEIHNKLPAGGTLSRFQYTYDVDGRIVTWAQQTDGNPARIYRLGYDAADQLMSATIETLDPTPIVLKRYRYAYDSVENRTSEQIDDVVAESVYNSVNQLIGRQAGGSFQFAGTLTEAATVTANGQAAVVDGDSRFAGQVTVAPPAHSIAITAQDPSGNARTDTYDIDVPGSASLLSYDANGNLTTDGEATYDWDAADRLLAVTRGAKRTDFIYDGRGRRVRILERENGVLTLDRRYVWCGLELCEERDADGMTVTRRFFRQGLQEGGEPFFLTTDHLGSVREMTDSTATIRAQYEYDPFGRRTRLSGDKDAPWGFTGHLLHAPSGLLLAPYRLYDPGLGRWAGPDPMGLQDGMNLYGYVHNDPVNLIDPSGDFAIALAPPVAAGLVKAGGWVVGALTAAIVGTALAEETAKREPTPWGGPPPRVPTPMPAPPPIPPAMPTSPTSGGAGTTTMGPPKPPMIPPPVVPTTPTIQVPSGPKPQCDQQQPPNCGLWFRMCMRTRRGFDKAKCFVLLALCLIQAGSGSGGPPGT